MDPDEIKQMATDINTMTTAVVAAATAPLEAEVERLRAALDKTSDQAYNRGYIDGITAYTWWHDGEQKVGTTGTSLTHAKATAKETWNYSP